MADERTDLIKRLAPLVLEDRSRTAADKRSTDIPWYFININHPAMRPFYNSWLQSRGRLFLPGDIDRAEFELSLLSNKALALWQINTREKADYERERTHPGGNRRRLRGTLCRRLLRPLPLLRQGSGKPGQRIHQRKGSNGMGARRV